MPPSKAQPAPAPPPCKHPPHRIFAWFARDDTAPKGQVFCGACCECGAVLKGAATDWPDSTTERRQRHA